MVFSTNQARHLYVAIAEKTGDDVNPADFVLGDVQVCVDKENNLYFKYCGKGGLLRSDLITNISYAKYTKAKDLETPLKKATVTVTSVDTNNSQDYVLRVTINQAFGMSDEEVYIREVAARSFSNSTPASIAAELTKLIKKTLGKDYAKLFNITNSGASIVFNEVEQEWSRGIKEQVTVDFTVELVPVEPGYTPTKAGSVTTYDWGTVTTGLTGTVIKDGKKIADLEYFCLGERGDQYRYKGWPNSIFNIADCMVDETKAYDVLDIHYAYQGTCEDIQKSEKDITIVSTNPDTLKSIATSVATKTGITVEGLQD